MPNFKKLTTGFTLIELLVVISIIGILATLMIANLNSGRSRVRDAERKSDIKNITTALRLYANDNNGTFPTDSSIPWGDIWSNSDGSTIYMQKVPKDPLSPDQDYVYTRGATGDTFTLYACLENSSDSQGTDTSNCTSGKMFQIIQ